MIPFFAVLGLVAGLVSAGEGEWPNFRGPASDGRARAEGVFAEGFGLSLAWRQPLGTGYSSVSIGSGLAVTLYGDGSKDHAIAFDATDGSPLWSYEIGQAYKGYGGSYDGPLASPLIDGDRVYGIGARGELFALNGKNGALLFQVDLKSLGAPEPLYGFTASPLVAGKVLIVQIGGEEAGLIGLDKLSGKRLWSSPALKTDYQTASLVDLLGQRQLVLSAVDKMVGIDPRDGRQLWEFETGCRGGAHALMAGKDKIFVSPVHFREEGLLVQVSRDGEAYSFKQLWKGGELGKSMGFPLYRDGYLYGYNGRFLACVDAVTGKRQWKSRPPGPGFAIIVEDHLAVVTQAGTVHLVEASPQGYREKSSLKVFDDIVYTPPAFSGGKLYLRSMGAIAAVDVGRLKRSQLVDKGEGFVEGSRFAKAVKQLESARDQPAAITRFLAKQTSFPVIEDEKFVHIVYRGQAKDVAVGIRCLDFQREFPMRRLGSSDFYYFSFQLDPKAQTSYALALDYQNATADPRNPRLSPSFWGDGFNSLLTMPQFSDGDHLAEPVSRGLIRDLEFDSKLTAVKRKAKVYLPAGYDQGGGRYPVLYVDYGFSALEKGLMDHTLDNLMGKQIQDMIVVFVPPQPVIRSDRGLKAGKKYAAMMVQELLPLIDTFYRTIPQAAGRGLLGHSWLGFAGLYTALHFPGQFSKVAIQSGLFETEYHEDLIDSAGKNGHEDLKILLEWGQYDLKGDVRRNIPELNTQLAESLRAKGLHVETSQQPLSDGWAHWRTRQDDLLKWMFPIQER